MVILSEVGEYCAFPFTVHVHQITSPHLSVNDALIIMLIRESRPLSKTFTHEVKEILANMWTLPRVIRQIVS